jgi:YHS domain-containing protein
MKLMLTCSCALMLGLGCEIPLDRPASTTDARRPQDEDRSTFSLKDPVCGVTCIGDRCERETFQDKQYCFCSKECKKKFDEDPRRYADSR